MAQTHSIVAGSLRRPMSGAVAVGAANPHSTVDITLKLRRSRPLPEPKTRPKRFLTRKDLAEFGASESDVNATVSALGKFGLSRTRIDPVRRTVQMRGTTAQMEEAFLVRLLNYDHPGGSFRGRTGHIHVPNALAGIVEGVFGLDNRRVVSRRRQPVRNRVRARALSAIPSNWYTSGKLAAHYNFPPGDGSGQTVGILEFGGGYFENDLEAYCQTAGVSLPSVKAISVDGTPTSAHDQSEGEVMLDVEVVAGACPNARIVLYFAEFTEQGWISALDAVAQDQDNDPGVVSVSWGFAEDADIWTEQAMDQVNQTLQELAQMGITVCVAAGDDGSSAAVSDGLAHVIFPGSSPYVLSVGGTTIPAQGPDVAWKEGDGLRNDGGGSTGGGMSAVFSRPSWQESIRTTSVDPGAIVGRCIPDVAANADWDASPYLLVVDGQAEPNGGTSAATPLWAALITRINQQRGTRTGYLTPLLYQTPSNGGIGSRGCTDVTSGDNKTASAGGYTAAPGYDLVSGWGTPDGVKLLAALAQTES